jgi:hypothetical protein
MQRYCETSSQFKDFGKKKNLKIFTNPSPGTWWLVPGYAPKTAVEEAWMTKPAEGFEGNDTGAWRAAPLGYRPGLQDRP